jgi:SpoVK/Ycf46/Vps4 family AAA+-type ATPase
VPLKLHLAELLLADGQPTSAQEHVGAVLHSDPANVAAIQLAASIAEALGDATRAAGYQRLASSLGAASPRAASPEAASPQAASPETVSPEAVSPEAASSGPAQTPDSMTPPRAPAPAGPRPERVALRLVEGNRPKAVIDVDPPEPVVTLKDVAGMEPVKRRLNLAFLAPLRNPELRRSFGKTLRGGLLLYGPPGCGKTFIARATAGELGARFMPVGIADVLDMWLGESEQKLKGYFETARRQSPSVLFFDEVDALGRKRSLLRHSAGSGVVSQFLSELDGLQGDNRGVFVLAATNHPWDVDSALRRPGRFDRMLLVLPPDAAAREAILRAHCRDRPVVPDLDFASIAAGTEDYSGADVAHLCESAAELALEESLSGAIQPITVAHFKRAMKEVRPTIRSWLETAKNHALFANDGGLYDDLLEYLRARRIL